MWVRRKSSSGPWFCIQLAPTLKDLGELRKLQQGFPFSISLLSHQPPLLFSIFLRSFSPSPHKILPLQSDQSISPKLYDVFLFITLIYPKFLCFLFLECGSFNCFSFLINALFVVLFLSLPLVELQISNSWGPDPIHARMTNSSPRRGASFWLNSAKTHLWGCCGEVDWCWTQRPGCDDEWMRTAIHY